MTDAVRLTVAMAPTERDSTNPYIDTLVRLLRGSDVTVIAADQLSAAGADVVHLHWPDLLVARRSLFAALRGVVLVLGLCLATRLRRRAVVWTVHNLGAHEPEHPHLERVFWRLFTPMVSGYISLTSTGAEQVRAAHPNLYGKPYRVIPHGSYAGSYPEWPGSRQQARDAFGILGQRPVLLFFGQLRPYKGIEKLVSVFGHASGLDATLAIAGACNDRDLRAVLRTAADADPRIRLEPRHIPDSEVAGWFAAADGVVLPFSRGLNSGSALLALTMGAPVLVPRTAVFDEIADVVGSRWLTRYDGALTPEVLQGFLDSVTNGMEGKPDLRRFAWPETAERTVNFYCSLNARNGWRRLRPTRRLAEVTNNSR